MVTAGINTIVTTHSDYFIEQFANHVRSSKLEGEQGCTPALSETDVSAYMFNRQSNGTIVERLHFDQENGFAARDHDQVSSDQYNETVRLLDQVGLAIGSAKYPKCFRYHSAWKLKMKLNRFRMSQASISCSSQEVFGEVLAKARRPLCLLGYDAGVDDHLVAGHCPEHTLP